jgi:Vacuolar protein sorting-associated protein 62
VSAEADLLARYSPYVQYDSLESYAADSVAIMTDCVPAGHPRGNALRQDGDRTLAEVDPPAGESKLELAFLRGGRYRDAGRTPVSAGDYLDVVGKAYVADAHEMHGLPGYADQVYGHTVRDAENRLWLQYWFFYYYNDKAFLGSGLHEGDWEMVQFRLGAKGSPVQATYAQHSHGERCAWREVEKEDGPDGPVPVVYSARGSHASYFRSGSYPQAPVVPDYNDAGGPRVRPQLNVIADASPAWVAWPGRWGSTRSLIPPVVGADSPPGPRWHDAWKDPQRFHEEARPAQELGAKAGVGLPTPPRPRIAASRRRARAVVSYEFPRPKASAPKLRGLLLSLDGHGDGLPPATQLFPATPKAGRIELPLKLDRNRPYTVRAVAVAENGLATAPSAVELPAS